MYCGKITSDKVGTKNTSPRTEIVAGELVAVKLATEIVPLYEPAGVPISLTEIVVVATVGAGKDNEELQVKPPLLEYSYPAKALIVKGSVKNWPATVKVLIAEGIGLFVENIFEGVMAPTVISGI
jgi:phosphate/sulfate permease